MTPRAGFDPVGLAAVRRWMRASVDHGWLPGASTLIARHGQVELFETYGARDLEQMAPLQHDTLFRIYSMTKPVTSVAAMILVERGELGLDDPVQTLIPSFSVLTVNRDGAGDTLEPEPLRVPITVRHLLTHTSGLTYGEGNPGAVSRAYVERRTDFGASDGPLAEVVDRLATIPLLFQPGTSWAYGVSTDVLGRVVEVVSGQPLDAFMHAHIFEPLGMLDTSFQVGPGQVERFAALYEVAEGNRLTCVESPESSPQTGAVSTLSGGAGLVSTASDYLCFAEMLRLGGSLDGVRVLVPQTVHAMVSNQLPGDLAEMGQPTFNETSMDGVGFGLGVAVVVDPSRSIWRSSPGEFAWGGYASTAFWVDPVHDVSVVFMTQVMPSDHYPIRAELRSLVLDALV